MNAFSPDILANRVALITGGGSGINLGIAEALHAHGAKVMLIGRTLDKVVNAAKSLDETGATAAGLSADVREYEAMEKAVEETITAFGGLDILVNGAAGNFLAPASQLSANGFKTVVDIDCNGTFNASRAAFESLADGGGVIINITANQAWVATPLQVHAGAAKAAVQKMTLDLALEWGQAGVRVVAIAPGPIDGTEGMARLATPELRDGLIKKMPLGRFGSVDEIGHAAVFLASDLASFITGTTLVVDGGQQLVGSAGFLDAMFG